MSGSLVWRCSLTRMPPRGPTSRPAATASLFSGRTPTPRTTSSHKRGKHVWGLGWFRDAVASTKKRTATASGHNGVVVAVAVCLPFGGVPILALPLLARLHRAGKVQPSCPQVARELLAEVLAWFPGRRFNLVGDGAYASSVLLADLDEQVTFVGRMRADAAVYDPRLPPAKKGRGGRTARKGPRLPSPKQAAARQ